jgi:hypothetical protein
MEGMPFVITIVNNNVNPFPISPDFWHELMFTPFTSWGFNQWLRLWDPIRPVHKALWDVVEVC